MNLLPLLTYFVLTVQKNKKNIKYNFSKFLPQILNFVLKFLVVKKVMSRVNQNMPALGNSRGIQYTRAEMSKDLQVYHLTSKHHPNQLYDSISPGYVHSIELKDNASGLYYNKMKSLYMDELDATLIQHQNRVMKNHSQAEQNKREYREKVNPMILCMEKQSQKMKQSLNDRVERQKIRGARFIDGEKVKTDKIQQFIDNNDYEKLKAKSHQMYNAEHTGQKQNLYKKSYNIGKGTQRGSYQTGINNSSNMNRIPFGQGSNSQGKTNQIDRHKIKQQNINNSVNASKQFASSANSVPQEKQDPNRKILRIHNPITYPLQYHVDNAYFLKGMQKMERSKTIQKSYY